MKRNFILGMITGVAAGAAAALAVDKVTKEIKSDLQDHVFPSPEGKNVVTLTCGTSATAKGLTYIRIFATADDKETCKLVAFAKKNEEYINGEWLDNDNFKLLIGKGKLKQRCDVSFDGDEISANLYFSNETEKK